METYQIKQLTLLLLIITATISCNKKNPNESISTTKGRIQGNYSGQSDEFFPLQMNNKWDYLYVTYDTLGKVTDSNVLTIQIKNQLVLTKTNDTFYNFDGFYFKNKDKTTVLSLDTGNNIITRIKTGMSSIQGLGTMSVWEEFPENNYSYVKHDFVLMPGLFIKYDHPCTKIQKTVKTSNGKLIRLVNEYYEGGKGLIAKDVWRSKNVNDSNSKTYLQLRIELKGYKLN